MGHWAVHQSQAVSPGWPIYVAEPPFQVRAEDEERTHECGGRDEAEDDDEREQALAGEATLVPLAERRRDPLHQGRGRRRGRPDGEDDADDRHQDAAARGLWWCG